MQGWGRESVASALAALGSVVAIEQRGRAADMASSGGIAAGSSDSISTGSQTCVVGMDNILGEGDGSDGDVCR